MKCSCRCSPDEYTFGGVVNEDSSDRTTCSHGSCGQFSLERNFVQKLPVVKNALTASTLVGGTVSNARNTFSKYTLGQKNLRRKKLLQNRNETWHEGTCPGDMQMIRNAV
ncbi:hypothetical protein TNCV_1107741 [Trichonephila clavipes]|nr:hypothetical protein TNCV_1107741 [Trichonephila clavipes]